MARGEPFRERHQRSIDRARQDVAEQTGLAVDVYVGTLLDPAGPRAAAVGLLSRTPEPERTVLIAVDPAARRVEVVTGAVARTRLDDRAVALVTMGMSTSFAVGDLVGGIVHGIRLLGDRVTPS